MKPDEIKPGRKYRLYFRYATSRATIDAEVLRLEKDAAVVRSISGREVEIPLQHFAKLAVEEVCSNSHCFEGGMPHDPPPKRCVS